MRPRQLLLHVYRAFREGWYRSRSPYAGVYGSFDEVPHQGGGFDDAAWAKTASDYSQFIQRKNQGFVPLAVVGEHALLPLLIAVLDRPVTIVDFGGATGFGYLNAVRGAPGARLTYTVVETPAVCEAGRQAIPHGCQFVTAIPTGHADIVLLGSALQCIDDWRGLLRQLVALQPTYILLTKTPAGDNRAFVTAQVNLPGKVHPLHLFHGPELVAALAELGYALRFISAVDGAINQDAFEPEYRVGAPCNLLFVRA